MNRNTQQNNNRQPRRQVPPSTAERRQNGNADSTPQRTDRSREYAQRQAAYARKMAYEREMARRREAEKRRRAAARRRSVRVFLGRTLVFLILFAILAVAAAVVFFLHFNHTDKDDLPAAVRYTYGGKAGDSLDAAYARQNDVLYVDFHETAEYLHMSWIGDATQMRFIIPTGEDADSAGTGDEEGVLFFADSDLAKVNGQDVRLDGKVILFQEHYLVPASFLLDYMTGVTCTVEGSTVAIARTYTDETADPLAFVLKNAETIPPIDEPDSSVTQLPVTLPQEDDLQVTFLADLSAYEEYMNPTDRDAYLILVNNSHTIDESYLPSDLTDVADTRKDGRNTQQMRLYAARALEALYIEMRENGYTDVSVTSAYRSYTYQNSLFNTYTANEMTRNPSLSLEEAQAITATYSARPGTSEHQTGLCCDMHNLSAADQAFANQAAYTWLQENAWKFGFILRFPEGKEEITEISFEPWHYRYVGRYHAKAIHDSGLCLEEYLSALEG